jgi:hypothetical protein
MNDHDLTTALLTIHRERTLLPDAVALRDELSRIPLRGLPQSRREWPSLGDRSLRGGFDVTRFAIAAVVVAIVGGFLLTETLTQRRDQEQLPGAVASATPVPTPRPTSEPSEPPDGPISSPDDTRSTQRIAGDGPALTWEPVATDFELGHPWGSVAFMRGSDRFIVRDRDDIVHASRDGVSWTSLGSPDTATERLLDHGESAGMLGDKRVYYLDDSATLQIVAPDGTETRHAFRGPIQWISSADGGSSAGIIVVESPTREDVIEDLLGSEVVEHGWVLSDVHYPKWTIDSGGRSYTIDLAANGYSDRGADGSGGAGRHRGEGGLRVATLGWHSLDGVEWTPIRQLPIGGWREIVGSEEGFFGLGDKRRPALWYSADGLTWKRIGRTDGHRLAPWPGVGVMVPEPARLMLARPDGLRELHLPPDVVAAGGSFREGSDVWAGPLGLLLADENSGLSAFSQDGVHWGLAEMPVDSSLRFTVRSIVVGDDTVLMAVQRCDDPGPNAGTGARCWEGVSGRVLPGSLWRGTLEPVPDPTDP